MRRRRDWELPRRLNLQTLQDLALSREEEEEEEEEEEGGGGGEEGGWRAIPPLDVLALEGW